MIFQERYAPRSQFLVSASRSRIASPTASVMPYPSIALDCPLFISPSRVDVTVQALFPVLGLAQVEQQERVHVRGVCASHAAGLPTLSPNQVLAAGRDGATRRILILVEAHGLPLWVLARCARAVTVRCPCSALSLARLLDGSGWRGGGRVACWQVPTVEFGVMHAVLFQMALLPLTMCRYTIAALSTTRLKEVSCSWAFRQYSIPCHNVVLGRMAWC
eukprot:scaffold2140_cov394-Prasinococcus_capsulatus_cf.AAC.11